MSAKKKPSMENIANELAGASAFFKTSPAQEQNTRKHEAYEVYEAHASREALEAREASAPQEAQPTRKTRNTIRRPFVVYEDQLIRLREIKARSVLEGKPLEIQDIVQEAIESFIKKYDAKHPKR
jgi:hypothetical protein